MLRLWDCSPKDVVPHPQLLSGIIMTGFADEEGDLGVVLCCPRGSA